MSPPAPAPSRPVRPGFTLLELCLVLLLGSATLAAFLPAARTQVHRLEVLRARERAVALVSDARRVAVRDGGAVLVVEVARGRLRVESAAGAGPWEEFPVSGVRLESPGADPGRLRFDALGLGRASSRTLVFRRGSVDARLTLSSYGRLRRW